MGDWDWASKWMEEVREDGERNQQQQSSNQKPDEGHVQHMSWSQSLRTLRPWYSFAPVVAVWSVCQLEMLLHPSLSTVEVCCRLLLVCLLWIVLGGCIYALQRCLRPGKSPELPQRKQQEPATESQNNQHLWMSQTQSSDLLVSLILALTDSLLLCVLQEPIPDPSVPHIEGLLSRLEAVAHTLQKVNVGSVGIFEEVDRGSILKDKPKLICTYLQQRLEALRTLVQVQGDFEASVNDMLQGLDGLWAQLEELHAGVTLTKQEGQGHRDLASAQTDAETLFTVLGHYRSRLQSCQAHLKDSMRLLQELTWSHTHISSRVDSSSESVWPELLLQSNIEQFDKVQEGFSSLEQQTATFQAHLEGLGKGNQDGFLTLTDRTHSGSASPQTSQHVSDVSLEELTSADTPLSLCERSALQLTSTFGRLRESGRRK
ncbi:uncharacterized protein si:ch211-151h10.2 isoform X2 [Melanotaenia boesemani]|uniref:uncharacterized protein si:ch211-151h10.2 isoform X2 n=1 Tax=Melanotaenia boesemani TaxID=1250792 RepID=UPI001C05C3FE|nr:uncharacterized protein si:ch211-151h10.2 isoform X2 [Melanotaenia boesemani]